MKRIKCILALALIFIMMVQMVYATGISNENGYTFTVVEDGITYTISMDVTDINDFTVTVKNQETMSKDVISCDDSMVKQSEYEYEGKTFWGREKYELVETEINDMSDEIEKLENGQVSSQGYGKVVKSTAGWCYKNSKGEKYYYTYKIGNSGSDVGYTIITCACAYKLKNNATSYLDKYEENMLLSNSSFAKSGVSVATMAVVAAVIVAVPAAAVALLIAGLGFGATATSHLIDSYNYHKTAATYYDKAKVYGVRIA